MTIRLWSIVVLVICAAASPALAETSIEGRVNLFYTDDVGIFSATRRLTRDGDPTQPALDTNLTDKGSDVVFEPDAKLATTFDNRFGKTELNVRGQGFIYADNPRFNHGPHVSDSGTTMRRTCFLAKMKTGNQVRRGWWMRRSPAISGPRGWSSG